MCGKTIPREHESARNRSAAGKCVRFLASTTENPRPCPPRMNLPRSLVRLIAASVLLAHVQGIEVTSLKELAESAAKDNGTVTMKPGVYRMADYLTDDVLQQIRGSVERSQARPPVPMYARAEMAMDAAPPPVAAGELTVRIDITGVYDLAR